MNELELFTEALSHTDPAERAAFLDEACAGNPDLRQRLDVLLAGQAQSRSPLDRLPGELVETANLLTEVADSEHPPDRAVATRANSDPDATVPAEWEADSSRAGRVPTGKEIGTVVAGRYMLVDVIGEGGMGSVYRASQTEPVKRQVALKLIKTGMDSREVLARFDAERQALALMDHPNIARIHDGGITPAGQPFFVMELVRGVPLTEYCDINRLSVKARLELFVLVCQAVQHAHQKRIIHRDLKPSNVLVTEVDGRPTPKVIDFGVAKATELKLTDMSFADTGAIVGTPAYMSPEQADPSTRDIDTRTDVYALGVILYELLTEAPPIDASQFQRGALLEMLRMVREVDPPRPSTRLSATEALPNIAANRSIEPARLSKLLQGELDWVVMKALEKDRNRRYETANGFAHDIQRYLDDEVVEARPPSRGYRLKKFVKRNKIQMIAASLVSMTLIIGIVGTSLGMVSAHKAERAEAKQRLKADDERDKAIAAERQTAIERDRALAAEAKTKTINDFLTQDLLTQAEPANNAVEDRVTLLEVLDRAAKKVGTRFADQPELQRALRVTIANTYHGLASWEKAEAQWRAVLDAERRRDPRSAGAYEAQGYLAHILRHRGRRDGEVLEMAEAAAKGLERTLGPDHPDTLITLGNLAGTYQDFGRVPEAIVLLERVRDAKIVKLGPDHTETLAMLSSLALAYQAVGKIPEAIALYERARDAQIAKLGPDHPDTLITLGNLAMAYWEAGKEPEAIALFERVRDASITRLGPDHPDTLITLHNLARAYQGDGKVPEAIGLYERVRDAQIARLGPDHPDTLITLADLAGAYRVGGRLPEAIVLLERVRDAHVTQLGPDHPTTLVTLTNLGTAYWSSKQFDKSIPLLEEVLKRQEAKIGRQHSHTQMTVANLGVNYKDAGRLTEAIPLLEEAHQAAKSSPQLRFVANELIEVYTKAGENAKLAALLQERLAESRKSLPKESPQLAGQLAQVGMPLLQQKRWTDAEPLLRECLAIREKSQSDVWSTFNTQSLLGGALLGQKKYAEAEPLLLAGYEGMKLREKTIPPQGQTRIPEALDRLIELSTATNKQDEVKKWQAERAKYPAVVPPSGQKK